MMEFPQETKLFERVRALMGLVGVLYDIAGLKSIVIKSRFCAKLDTKTGTDKTYKQFN